VLTVAAIMAILWPLAPLYQTRRGTQSVSETKPHMLITFLTPVKPPPAAVRSPMPKDKRPAPTTEQQPASAVPEQTQPLFPSSGLTEHAVPQHQAVSAPPVTTAPATDTGTTTSSSDIAAPTQRATGPRERRAGISTTRPLTAGARDSVLAQIASDAPTLAKTRRLTQAETDSALREKAMLERVAHDQHRPPMLHTGGGSFPIPFPIFSYSKSPEQQVRDSTLNADILARLARIARRERAKRDSLRKADSVAKARLRHMDVEQPLGQ
jgi:hypothetical protein